MSNQNEIIGQDQTVQNVPAEISNPFGSSRSTVAGISAQVEIQRTISEVQAAIVLAKQFPRNKVDSADRILTECCRTSLANAATYSYTRGGQEVTGPTIRLAEVIATNWGNFQFGWDEIGRANGQSEILAWAWDCETNVRRTTKFFVKHWRDTKRGGYAPKDERDIYELCANQAARRMRACILNIVPGDVVEAAMAQCERTLVQNEVITPEKIKALLEAFDKFGVTKEHIEKRIGRKADTINGAVMAQLRRIYNSLSSEMAKPSEFFEIEQKGGETSSTNKLDEFAAL